MDATAAEAIRAFSPNRFYDLYSDGALEACGGGPITAAMIAAEAMGADVAQIIAQRNSGDVTGDKRGYIVGYLSAALFQGKPNSEREYVLSEEKPDTHDITDHATIDADRTLNDSERELLRTTARRSLEHAIKGAKISCPEAPTVRLREKRGVFVTLKQRGDLRGCVGYVRPFKPLVEAVWEMAESAALRDHRFIPVEPKEVDRLEIEITVLSPLKAIADPNKVLVGRHGLLVSRGHLAGVLLPQVPIEHDWDRETFLAETCIKAGLDPLAWKDPATTPRNLHGRNLLRLECHAAPPSTASPRASNVSSIGTSSASRPIPRHGPDPKMSHRSHFLTDSKSRGRISRAGSWSRSSHLIGLTEGR